MKSTRFAAVLASVACGALAFAACSSKNGARPGASGDGGAPGDGSGSDAPLACPPANLDEWQAGAYHHAQVVQPTACTSLLINDYYNACLGSMASQESCDEDWGAGEDAAHATCQSCILTSSTASMWGPLVDYGTGADGGAGGTVSVNVAGCVEILDPSQLSCAMSVQEADECQHAACDPGCPVSDATSFADWQACIGATGGQSECGAYLQSAACVNGEDAGPAAACVTGKTFEDVFFSIATVFCGSSSMKD
jgi:hypothetical protein